MYIEKKDSNIRKDDQSTHSNRKTKLKQMILFQLELKRINYTAFLDAKKHPRSLLVVIKLRHPL